MRLASRPSSDPAKPVRIVIWSENPATGEISATDANMLAAAGLAWSVFGVGLAGALNSHGTRAVLAAVVTAIAGLAATVLTGPMVVAALVTRWIKHRYPET